MSSQWPGACNSAGKGPSRIGDRGEKAREGSSTLVPETSAVWPPWRHKTEEKEGGGEGTKATTEEGTKSSIQEVAENEGLRTEKRKHDIQEDLPGQVA